tara:strand:- start:23571 stop:24200 length:630 start_codon:yes stop_codon:yes gene_type:complete
VKLNLESVIDFIKSAREYLFPLKKITNKFSKINSDNDLQNFIQERSAHVTQTTLYGYLKTRMGHKFTVMVTDNEFSKSINIAKWNIYVVAISDLTFYTFSYLINQKNLKQNNASDIFHNIINGELKNGLDEKIYNEAKKKFDLKINSINWSSYYLENPFRESGFALYYWSPIADELKKLDKDIVLNSIKLKWNLVENEFKDLTKDLKLN